jgi:hypothetical protein
VPGQEAPKTYRRRIRIETPVPGVVFGALEDTAHHVRVTLSFDDNQVRSAIGEAVRLPWTTCPGAAAGLASLVGATLTTSLPQLRALYRAPEHCTHFFDLAQLCLAQAASGRRERSYEAVGQASGARTEAHLLRDGETILEWTIEGGTIASPAAFAGVGLRQGFVRWCDEHLDDDAAEAAFVLRRAASMTGVANLRMDDFSVVAESGLSPGVCFTAQDERIMVAFRHVGSQRDYSANSDEMLEGFDDARPR